MDAFVEMSGDTGDPLDVPKFALKRFSGRYDVLSEALQANAIRNVTDRYLNQSSIREIWGTNTRGFELRLAKRYGVDASKIRYYRKKK